MIRINIPVYTVVLLYVQYNLSVVTWSVFIIYNTNTVNWYIWYQYIFTVYAYIYSREY